LTALFNTEIELFRFDYFSILNNDISVIRVNGAFKIIYISIRYNIAIAKNINPTKNLVIKLLFSPFEFLFKKIKSNDIKRKYIAAIKL
jgi:hypothetical protein